MEALLLVIERGGPMMFARIGIMRALYPHDELAPTASRKKAAKEDKIVR